MEYRIRSNGNIKTMNDIRVEYSNTSLPSVWDEGIYDMLGIDPIFEGPQPTLTRYETSYRDGIQEVNGKWYTKYSIGPVFVDLLDGDGNVAATAAALNAAYVSSIDSTQAHQVRTTRNIKLAETDWRFRSDLTPSQEWKDYCQELRNISAQEGFPWDITWPDAPNTEGS